MLKKTIEYVDQFTGEPTSGVFYFNLNEVELARLDAKYGEGGLVGFLETLDPEKDLEEVINFFEFFIGLSYGCPKTDEDTGIKYFYKSEDLSARFMMTEAYNSLFIEMMKDASGAITFFKQIFPKHLVEQADLNNLANGR